MILTYSGRSAPSANKIALENADIELNRGSEGDINWGRAKANTKLNPDISNVTNKRVMRGLFSEAGVPMPRLMDTISDWTFPVVGRPDTHTRGRGFWKCHNWFEVQKAMKGTRKKRGATHFMAFVEAPREYRVHIFKGKSIRISEKIFDGDEYTTGKPQHNVKHVRESAKQALKAVGLDFGAVDILADDDQCWVLEVNAGAGIGGSLPQLYAKVFTEWYNDTH